MTPTAADITRAQALIDQRIAGLATELRGMSKADENKFSDIIEDILLNPTNLRIQPEQVLRVVATLAAIGIAPVMLRIAQERIEDP